MQCICNHLKQRLKYQSQIRKIVKNFFSSNCFAQSLFEKVMKNTIFDVGSKAMLFILFPRYFVTLEKFCKGNVNHQPSCF